MVQRPCHWAELILTVPSLSVWVGLATMGLIRWKDFVEQLRSLSSWLWVHHRRWSWVGRSTPSLYTRETGSQESVCPWPWTNKQPCCKKVKWQETAGSLSWLSTAPNWQPARSPVLHHKAAWTLVGSFPSLGRELSPSQHLDSSLIKPCRALPGLLTQRKDEIINVGCFNLLSL